MPSKLSSGYWEPVTYSFNRQYLSLHKKFLELTEGRILKVLCWPMPIVGCALGKCQLKELFLHIGCNLNNGEVVR